MADSLPIDDQVLRHQLERALQGWERSAEVAIQHLHARLDGVLLHDQQQVVEMEWRLGGMNTAVPDQIEGFYGAFDGRRDDRLERAEDNEMAHLHERLDAMHHTREQERGHEQGMSY